MMDPLGLALENFDATGKWRTRGESSQPIDASAVLPDGTKIDGPDGLRNALLARSDRFVSTLTEKLLTLCARATARVLRCAGRAGDRPRSGAQRLPLLVRARAGDRAEHAVPNEETAVMIVTKMALPRRTFLRGMGVSLALPCWTPWSRR